MKYLLLVALFSSGCATSPPAPNFKGEVVLSACKKGKLEYVINEKLKDINLIDKETKVSDFLKTTRSKCNNSYIYRVDTKEFNDWMELDSTTDSLLYTKPPLGKGPTKEEIFIRDNVADQEKDIKDKVDIFTISIKEAFKRQQEEELQLKSFDKPYRFSLSLEYPDMTGRLKEDAKNARAALLGSFIKRSVIAVSKLPEHRIFQEYLDSNMPIPLDEEGYEDKDLRKKLRDTADKIRAMIPEKYQYGNSRDDDEKNTGMETLSDDDEKEYRKIEAALGVHDARERGMPEKRTLIEGKDERSLLTGVYLLAVTTFEIKRSDDGKVITIELKVDIPQLFKEFEFEKISKFIE